MEINEAIKSEILKEFMTDDYLNYDNLINIKNRFNQNTPKSIKLDAFLKIDKYLILKNEITNLKFKRDYTPDSHSYSHSVIGNKFNNLIISKEFKTFISFIIGKSIKKFDVNSILLKHKDYTLLSDEKIEPYFEINFFFTEKWDEEFGGYFSYINDEELIRILPSGNSLTLVYLDGIKSFIKYININSNGNKNYLVSLNF